MPSFPCHCVGWSAYLGAVAVDNHCRLRCPPATSISMKNLTILLNELVLPATYWYFDDIRTIAYCLNCIFVGIKERSCSRARLPSELARICKASKRGVGDCEALEQVCASPIIVGSLDNTSSGHQFSSASILSQVQLDPCLKKGLTNQKFKRGMPAQHARRQAGGGLEGKKANFQG